MSTKTDLNAEYNAKTKTVEVYFWSNLVGTTGMSLAVRLTTTEAQELMDELAKALAAIPVEAAAVDFGVAA